MATESTITTQIRSALAQHLKRDVSKIRPPDRLREDLGLDSLAMIELLFKIEEHFDLEIPNEDLSRITTVADVTAYVEEKLGARTTAAAAPRGSRPCPGAARKRGGQARAGPSRSGQGDIDQGRGQAEGRGYRDQGGARQEKGVARRMSGGPMPVTARLGEIAAAVGGSVIGPDDTPITGVSSLEDAEPGDLAYVEGERFAEAARASRASAFVVASAIAGVERPQLVVAAPRLAFVRIVERFFTSPRRPRGIASQVTRGLDVSIGPDPSIWPFVTLGNRVRLGARVMLFPGVFIGDDAVVGDDATLYPNVTVLERCVLGARVIVHSGAVIGSDGFGYVQHEGRHHKIPQRGIVVIEDDVELGANVAVDRATFGRTLIRRGTKVDNLVQIAHNVEIGEHAVLAGQAGVSGSTRIGSHVMVGGQAGFADHVEVGDGAMVAAQAGVFRTVPGGTTVAGTPALPREEALLIHGALLRLPDLRKQLRQLELRVRELEAQAKPAPRARRRRA